MAFLFGLIALGGCGSSSGDIFQQGQIGAVLAANPHVAGTSVSDIWAALDVVDGNQKPLAAVGHTSGGLLWQTILLPQLKQIGGCATAGENALWVSGTTAAQAPTFLRVTTDGNVQDFAADLPMGATSSGIYSLAAANGGVFGTVSYTGTDTMLHTSLLKQQGGHFQAVPGFPAPLEARVMAVAGPDEAYLWMNTGGVEGISHYAAGAFTDIPYGGDLSIVTVILGSPTDVWIHSGVEEGITVLHGDGTSFTTLKVSGWPTGPWAVRLVSAGGGQANVIAYQDIHVAGSLPSSELDAVSLGADGHVTGQKRVARCADAGDCPSSSDSAFQLNDGTLILISYSQTSWFLGKL